MTSYPLSQAPKRLLDTMDSYDGLFGSLSHTIMVEVYEAKEQIISYNHPITRLRFMIEGRAKITLIHENGNQSIVHFVYPGSYLGELTFLDIEKEHKNVYAISPCVFVSVDLFEAQRVLRQDATFLYGLGQFIGDKMLRRTSFHTKNQNYELRNRLAAYILATEHQGIYYEKHTETADYLAVSYRHLLYTIKAFREEGLLKKVSKGYAIEKEALRDLAKDIQIL